MFRSHLILFNLWGYRLWPETNESTPEDHQQKKITEFFIQNIRREIESLEVQQEDLDVPNRQEIEETEPLSTQNMIEDARERRSLKLRGVSEMSKCDVCQFTTGSKTLLKSHIEKTHKEPQKDHSQEMRKRFSCDQCEFKTTSQTVLKRAATGTICC